MGGSTSNKYGSFENDIQLQLGPIVIWWLGLLLRLPLGELKHYITKRRCKQGAIVNAVTWNVCCQKFWIPEQFQNKPEKRVFSSTFSLPKKFRTIQRIQGLGALKLYVWSYMNHLVIFHPPSPTNGSPWVILKIPFTPNSIILTSFNALRHIIFQWGNDIVSSP